MQYSDSETELIETGIKPETLVVEFSVPNTIDIRKKIGSICDKTMMGLTIEWKSGKSIMNGPVDIIVGYGMRSGVISCEITPENESTSLRFLTYSWVVFPKMKVQEYLISQFN